MLQALTKNVKKIASSFTAGVLLFSQFAVVPVVGATSGPNLNKIGICHATNSQTNPYTTNEVDKSSIDNVGNQYLNGHGDHTGPVWYQGIADHSWGDIIPPFTNDAGHAFPGQNWTTAGQAIWSNNCETTRVEVKKVVAPANDPGKFNLKVAGKIHATDVGNGGTTGKVFVGSTQDVSIAEAAGTGTLLTDYTTSIECRDNGGRGAVVDSGTSTGTNSRGLTIEKEKIDAGDDIVCVITNTRKVVNNPTGNLKVVKDVVNDNGGTKTYADFTFKVNANDSPRHFDPTTSPDGEKVVSLPAGTTFAVSEVEANTGGYATTYSAGCSGTIIEGQTKVCTITNDDISGQLRVVKKVVNNNGGNAEASDFTLSVNGQAKTQNQYFAVTPGVYAVTESGPAGYEQTGIACVDDGTKQSLTHPVTVQLGQSVTCTVTNDDIAPKLTVIKHVINDNGGTKVASDFTMLISGNNASDDSFLGNEGGTTITLHPGAYSVSESGPEGYLGSYSNGCEGTIALGEHKICTVTNDDKAPVLVLVKKVLGGTASPEDWLLKAVGPTTISGNGGVTSDETFSAGSYSLSELGGPDGYLASGWKCDGGMQEGSWITLNLGQSATCTITNSKVNEEKAAKLTIIKKTLPSGSQQEFEFSSDELDADFTLKDGEHKDFDNLRAGSYTISEDETDGWALKNIVCWGLSHHEKDLEGGSVTVELKPGDEATCKFINEEQANIHGFKFEDLNGNGQRDEGEPKISGWTISLEKVCPDEQDVSLARSFGCEEFTDSTQTDQNGNYSFGGLAPGKYIVCEEQRDGWVQTYPDSEDGCYEIWLDCGQKEFAKFGNFELGKVVGVKFNDINGNGSRGENEPGLKNWEISLIKECEPELPDFRTETFDGAEPDCEDEVTVVKTDQNGEFTFANLWPGKYKVCEEVRTDWKQIFPGTEDGCHEVILETSGQIVVADFGNKAKGQVLGETTPPPAAPGAPITVTPVTAPKRLVVTGAAASKNVLIGLVILGGLGALHFASSRRKSYSKAV